MVDYKEEIETINDAIEALAKVGVLYLFKDFKKSKQIIEMQKELFELREQTIEKHKIVQSMCNLLVGYTPKFRQIQTKKTPSPLR